MRMAGIEVDPRGVVDNLRFRRITETNGEEYVVAYTRNTRDEFSDNVPLFIRTEEGWSEITFRRQSNIEIGVYFEPNNSFWNNQNSINIIARKFNGIVIPYFWHVNFPEQNRNDFGLSNTYENIARLSDTQIIPTAAVWQNRDFLPQWFVQNPNFGSFSQMLINTLNRIPSNTSFIPVVNEPYPGDFLSSSLQLPPGYNNYIEYSFETARQTKPGIPLILNNFNILLNQPNYRFTHNIASSLVNSGLIDGIGIQLHLDVQNIPSEDYLISSFRAWNELGLPVYLTEVSVNIPNETQRAEIFRRIVRAARATDVRSLNLWGAGPASWRGSQSTIFSDQFRPNPGYYSILEELFNN
jgi:endo-1,4-beta-xylanase